MRPNAERASPLPGRGHGIGESAGDEFDPPACGAITSGRYQLANPDTPEGCAFFRSRVEQLPAAYPEVTRLAPYGTGIAERRGWTSKRTPSQNEAVHATL